MNKGRPTEKDAQAAAELLMQITINRNTNQVLRNLLDTFINDPKGNDRYYGVNQNDEQHQLSHAADQIAEYMNAAKKGQLETIDEYQMFRNNMGF